MLLENSRRVIRLENPVIEARLDRSQSIQFRSGRHRRGKERHGLRQQHLPRPQNPHSSRKRASAFSPANSVARNSPVERSTKANPIVPAAALPREVARPPAPAANSPPTPVPPPLGNYSPSARPTPAPVAVPGVSTRITSRRTIFFPGPGSSICSQIATLWPARISRAM